MTHQKVKNHTTKELTDIEEDESQLPTQKNDKND
jgi:hypothetical protein